MIRNIVAGSVKSILNPMPAFFSIKPTIKVVIRNFLLGFLFMLCENRITALVTEIYFIFSTVFLLRTITILLIPSISEQYFYESEEIVCQ